MAKIQLTEYGFKWASATVTRLVEVNGYVVIEVAGTKEKVRVQVSPKGNTITVEGPLPLGGADD